MLITHDGLDTEQETEIEIWIDTYEDLHMDKDKVHIHGDRQQQR